MIPAGWSNSTARTRTSTPIGVGQERPFSRARRRKGPQKTPRSSSASDAPGKPAGDAMHLAVASHHACDFLLTWNCRNPGNPQMFHHIRVVNNLLGLDVPIITTPQQLLGGE